MTAAPGQLCVVERPDGKPYRAKKPPVAHSWDNDGIDYRYGVVVIRTHDIETASELAGAEFRWLGWSDGDDLPEPWVGWAKCVPRGGDWVWLHVDPGTRGAVPCVEFEVNDR